MVIFSSWHYYNANYPLALLCWVLTHWEGGTWDQASHNLFVLVLCWEDDHTQAKMTEQTSQFYLKKTWIMMCYPYSLYIWRLFSLESWQLHLIFIRAWGDGSVNKVLGIQAWRLGFRPQHPHKMLGLVVSTCNSSVQRQRLVNMRNHWPNSLAELVSFAY